MDRHFCSEIGSTKKTVLEIAAVLTETREQEREEACKAICRSCERGERTYLVRGHYEHSDLPLPRCDADEIRRTFRGKPPMEEA